MSPVVRDWLAISCGTRGEVQFYPTTDQVARNAGGRWSSLSDSFNSTERRRAHPDAPAPAEQETAW